MGRAFFSQGEERTNSLSLYANYASFRGIRRRATIYTDSPASSRLIIAQLSTGRGIRFGIVTRPRTSPRHAVTRRNFFPNCVDVITALIPPFRPRFAIVIANFRDSRCPLLCSGKTRETSYPLIFSLNGAMMISRRRNCRRAIPFSRARIFVAMAHSILCCRPENYT